MQMLMCRICIALLVSCVLGTARASGQSGSRVEIGGHVALLRIGESVGTNAGLGGRVSVDFTDWASAEMQFSYFPADTVETSASTTPVPGLRFAFHRRRSEALFGVKMGRRSGRVGAFAIVRPGFTRLSDRGRECLGEPCTRVLPPAPLPPTAYGTEFVLNTGGVFEFYPSARIVGRFELGDTRIRNANNAPPCPGERCTTHNTAFTAGIGFRF